MSNIGNKEIFAKNLLYYIKKSGVTQRDVAEVVDVSPSTFNEWIKGKKYPRIDKIEKLANYFGIQKSDLIEEYTEKNNSPDKQELTEGERKWLELYHQISDDAKKLLIEMANSFEKMSPDTQRFLLGAIRADINDQK